MTAVTKKLTRNEQLKTPSILEEIKINNETYYNKFTIKIKDDGRGMSKSDMDKIFHDF